MVRFEALDVAQNRFQRYDWRLQVVLIGWCVSVAILIVGIKLLTANATILSIMP